MMNAINNDAINNDKLDISDYNQNDDLLELMSLVGGEEDDEDITEDVIDFLLNQYKNEVQRTLTQNCAYITLCFYFDNVRC